MIVQINGDEIKEFLGFLITRCKCSLVGWRHLNCSDFSICLQASNGGHTSDYSSSLPSSPNVGHRELRAEAVAVAGLSTPGSLHRAAKRRTSLFAVLDMLTFLSSRLLLPAYLLWFLDPSVGPLFIHLPCPSISISLHPSSN